MSETYECVCIVCHRKFQSRREYARLCSGRCKSELGNLRRQGIAALVWAAQARADIPFADVAHTATLADLLAPELEIDEGPTALWCWWEDTGRIRTLRIDRGALRSNAVAIEAQRISPRRIVDGVPLPTTAADATQCAQSACHP